MLPAAPLIATLMVLFQTFCKSSWSSCAQVVQKSGIDPSTDIQQSEFIRSKFQKGEHLVMRTTHVPDIIAQLEDPIIFSCN